MGTRRGTEYSTTGVDENVLASDPTLSSPHLFTAYLWDVPLIPAALNSSTCTPYDNPY